MANAFDIRHFFRRAPRDWLKRYFDRAGLLADFDWSTLGKRKIDPLLRRWAEIDEGQMRQAVEDFRNIKMLATPACKVQIIDEAAYFGLEDEVSAKLLLLGDFYACAFWVMLEQPKCWEGALRYALADGKSKRYWRKRINMPKLGRHPTDRDALTLAAALTHLFTKSEARGSKCVVHPYRRGADGRLEYFFAYPEDHKHTPLVFEEDELVARPHNPAFEVIFVHDDHEQTLSIWHEGDKERFKDLQVVFSQAVLSARILRDSPKDDRAYDLQPFLDPGFTFAPDPVLGIEGVELRKMRVRVGGRTGRSILIELNKDTPSYVLYEDINAIRARIPPSQLEVTLVGLCATFDQLPGEQNKRTRTFQIVAPNSCNLKIDDFSPLIERLLVDHDIEPRTRRRKEDEQVN
jgi:hypothetical protein